MKVTSLLLFGVLALSGCNPKTPKASAPKRNIAAPSPATHATSWNWENYPPVRKMRVATLPCQLQPKSTVTVQSPVSGTLRVYVNTPQANLTAGFLWAEFEPEVFAAEEKSIKEQEERLNEREKILYELELPKQKLQMTKQLEELQRQVDLLRYVSSNKDLSSTIYSVGTNNEPLFRPDSLSKSETELALLRQSMSYLEKTNLVAMGLDIAGQRSDLDRRKADFEHRQTLSRFKMPFNGRLTVSIPLTEGVKEYPVNNAAEIGVIRDLSSVRLRLPVANPAWMGLPGEKLSATVRLPGGEFLEASFIYQKIEKNQNREESIYYFQFPDWKAAAAARLIGTDLSCDLWATLDEPVRIVPKLALVLYDQTAFQTRSWAAGLATAFPGAQLIVEGQTDLGIIIPAEMKLSSAK